MNILIDCRFWGLEHAGLGRYVLNLIKTIIDLDRANKYLLLATREKYQEMSSILPKAKVISVNAKHYSFKEQVALPLVIKKIKYDLIHFPHFNAPILTGFKKPMVLTIHDLIKDESRGLETTTRHPAVYLLKYLGYKATMLQALKKASKIIVPSKWVKKEVVRRYRVQKDKLAVIYEGIEDKFKIPACTGRQNGEIKITKQGSKILDKYNVKKPYFIYVGSAYPHKNLRNLMFAIKLINQSDYDKSSAGRQSTVNLVIVCSRDVFWQRLKEQIVQAGVEEYINLAGFVPDDELTVLYNQAVAFVTPSLMEGFGLPGLEAMACGCPVIASKKAALPEIYGKAAEYLDPENLDDIKDKMVKLLAISQERRKKMIQKGKMQAQKYSWQKCAKETLKIYSSLRN